MALRAGLVLSLAGQASTHRAAAGAVLGSHLDGVGHAGEFLELRVHVLEGCGGLLQEFLVVDLVADDGMRADEDALAALDAQVGFPDRDLEGDVALFPLGGAGREGAVDGQGRDRDGIAIEGDHRPEDIRDEIGAAAGTGARRVSLLVTLAGTLTSCRLARVWSTAAIVLLDDGFTALAVGLLDGFLDLGDGFVARQDAGDGEEAGLHDGVDAAAHAGLLGNIVGVDDVELEFLLDDVLLDFLRQLVPDFLRAVDAVQQEDRAGLGILERCRSVPGR